MKNRDFCKKLYQNTRFYSEKIETNRGPKRPEASTPLSLLLLLDVRHR